MISLTVFDKIPTFLDFLFVFISSSVGGYSDVVKTVIKIVKVEATAPIKKPKEWLTEFHFPFYHLMPKLQKTLKLQG